MKWKQFKNYKGKTIGRWTILDKIRIKDPKCKFKKTLWVCRCQCGNIYNVHSATIFNGDSTGCENCADRHHRPKHDLTDQKFGQLITLYPIKIEKKWLWHCQCSCGKTVNIPGWDLLNKSRVSCGCYVKEQGNKSRRWKGIGEISHSHFLSIINRAKSANMQFNITIEYLWKLFINQNKKCAISGLKLDFSKTHKERKNTCTASLDRIDSSKGYIEGNVQWVHKDINYMKQRYSQEYFINMCHIISEHNKK